MKFVPYIKSYISDLFDWNKNYFFRKKDLFCAKKEEGKRISFPMPAELLDLECIFVLSTGRCGTGFITKILRKSPELIVEHNPKPELEYVSSLIHRENPSIDSLKLAILASRFDTYFLDSYYRRKIYVETNNRITFFAEALSEMMPNAKFIHLVRNPADFVRSGMRRRYYQDGNIMHQRLNPIHFDGWEEMSPFEKISYEWNEINLSIENFKSRSMKDRCITIKSEDLFSKAETITLLFDFLNIKNPFESMPSTIIKSRLLSKPVNKQTIGHYPKYNEWSENKKVTLRKLASLYSKYDYDI